MIEKGIPSESVIAQMTVDKYVYGMPLHRQLDRYKRMGVRIPASSASDWIMKGWDHLKPLWELLRLMVINQKYLQVDETPIKVLDRDHKNGIHNGYMWLYHAPVDRLVVFDYRKGRDQFVLKQMLADFRGIIQTDGYKVYESPAGCRILYTLLFLTYFEVEIFYMPFAMASEDPLYVNKWTKF